MQHELNISRSYQFRPCSARAATACHGMAMILAIGLSACQQDEMRSTHQLQATDVVHVSNISSADIGSDGDDHLMAGLDEPLSDVMDASPPQLRRS